MILDARAGADFDELAAFLPAAGARTVLCSAEAAQALPFPRRATGEIMALRERAAPVEEAEILWDPAPGCYIPFYVQAKRPAFSRRRLSRFISTSPTGRATGPPAPPPFARGFPGRLCHLFCKNGGIGGIVRGGCAAGCPAPRAGGTGCPRFGGKPAGGYHLYFPRFGGKRSLLSNSWIYWTQPFCRADVQERNNL